MAGVPGAEWAWTAAAVVAAVPAVVRVAADLRSGRFGADVLALVGTVLVGFAGAVVAVMFGGGRALDAYAQRRAGRDLSALLDRAPSGCAPTPDCGCSPCGTCDRGSTWCSARAR
ncbi:hypothetical protein [Umezawaea sp.]|uniref:hypothetical protein n=1 Tax=Umezawaea sp. TaxID=1955258 RepID=UPI002ED14BBE